MEVFSSGHMSYDLLFILEHERILNVRVYGSQKFGVKWLFEGMNVKIGL